jgi:hypothetical protein
MLNHVWFAKKKEKNVTFDVYCYLFIAKIVSFFNNIEIPAIVVCF